MASSRGGRRGNFGPWGRLKPVHQPELEQYGLPSKGDKRLLDRSLQETYYAKIVESYMKFCASSTSSDELAQQFASMSLAYTTPTSGGQNNKTAAAANQLSAIFSAIRSLREGIVASGRKDTFAQQVYMFTIRASILTSHMESYHPALLHLLKVLHTAQPLQKTDLAEFAAYLVLDMTCRQRDYAAAFATRRFYGLDDVKVDAVIRAVVHDNYHLFWKTKKSVDKYRAKLMEAAEREMRSLALKCLSRTYFSVDMDFLHRVTQADWEELKRSFNVGWEVSGTTVIIRKPKGK